MYDIPEERQADFQRYKDTIDLTTFPKQWMARFSSKTPEEKDAWFRERFRCLYDAVYLGGFSDENWEPIMGMDFQENPHRALFAQFPTFRPGYTISVDIRKKDALGMDITEAANIPVPLSDLETIFKKKMILWPRGLFKTSASVVKIVQFILNYPNIRMCFLTGGDQLAKRQLSRVKRFFEKPTSRFQRLFPEFCVKSVLDKRTQKWEDVPVKMGNAHEFTVPARTNTTFAEPTFAISTAKSVKAGSHFDIIFVDDLVNDQNYKSVKLLEKCFQDYLDVVPLLETNGFLFMTGTRYSFGDTYQRIQELADEEEKEKGKTIWKFSVQSCWDYVCKHCGHGQAFHCKDINIAEPPCMLKCGCPGYEPVETKGVLFPQFRTHDGRLMGHTVEGLEAMRIEITPDFFANQYENQPIASGTQVFTQDIIDKQTLFHPQQIPDYAVSRTFIIGDLAYEGQEGRDYSVLFVCRLFRGQIFIFDCYFGNWDSHEIAVNMVHAILKHRPNMVFPEKFNGWEAYDNVIRSYALTQGLQNLPITWLKGSQAPKAKLARIGSVKGPLANHRLWLYSNMINSAVGAPAKASTQNGYALLVNQLLKWPKLGKHDDFADCAGQTVAAPTGYELETPPAVEPATNWLRKLSDRPIPDEYYPDTGMGTGLIG